MSSIHLLPIAILSTILIASSRGEENCRYSKIDDRTYSEIFCQDLHAFPKFEKLTDNKLNGEITVRKLHIGGDFIQFPPNGLEKFKYVDKLILDLSNTDLEIAGSDKNEVFVLTDCSIGELTLKDRAALNLLPLKSAVHSNTIANLTSLIIENHNIKMDDQTFEGASNLRYLAMRHGVMTIGVRAKPFKPFASTLTELDLSHNEVTLKSDWIRALEVLTNLKILRLNDNKIDTVTPELDVTSSYPQLQIFDLSGNQDLKRVDFTLRYLEDFKLDYCQFDELPIESLRNSSLLKRFSIKGNRLENLTENSFVSNPLLEYLNLNENPLRDLEIGSFRELVQLSNFTIRDWDLERLDLSVFVTDMKGLEVLNVEDNRNLKSVFLSDNHSIPISLKYLNLRNNSLDDMDESLDEFLWRYAELQIRISDESSFKCPNLDEVSENTNSTTNATIIDINAASIIAVDNSTTDRNNSTNVQIVKETIVETVIVETTTRNFTAHPWMWLAVQYMCRHKVLIDDDVSCEQQRDRKGNPMKLKDYLADLKPDCTGIEGTTSTTAPTSPSTRRSNTSKSSASQLHQRYDLIFYILAAMFLVFAMK